jgi:glucosamine--fructose-6-phosphate aminotransferase (isomerizing)
MCGIIGYKGSEGVGSILLKAVKNLEYRGYDSVGMASLHEGKMTIKKDMGKVDEVNQKLDFSSLKGDMGIAHSRWSTHGRPSQINSHPHADCKGRVSVIQNGIIENYQTLRKELVSKGHKFISDTDTEIIPHIIEDLLAEGRDIKEAVRTAFKQLKGRNSIVVLDRDSQSVIGARNGSPLIVGVGNNENFIASDIPAFLEYTRNVMYLDDDEMVVFAEEPKFFSVRTGEEVEKRLVTIEWDAKQAEKGDYPHFLIKEIMEQKDTIMRAINQNDNEILNISEKINSAFGTFLTGCGTAGKVCLAGEYLFAKIAKKHINYIVSSEFPNYEHFLNPETLLIAISQSGETADVLDAIESAKKKGVKILSLVNVQGSSLDRISDYSFLINAGPEKAVASTKATTSQLALITLLAYAATGKLKEGKRLLLDVAGKVNDLLNPRYDEHIKNLANKLKNEVSIYLIGRGLNYPIALEGAIKIMEVSQIHAQGFAGGELKHGPLALIGESTPCIAIVANDETKDHTLSNAMEIKARGGFIIGISPENNDIFDYWIRVPDVGLASPIVNIIPIQILAYYLGILRGCDPDYCRNLAKSVTVK